MKNKPAKQTRTKRLYPIPSDNDHPLVARVGSTAVFLGPDGQFILDTPALNRGRMNRDGYYRELRQRKTESAKRVAEYLLIEFIKSVPCPTLQAAMDRAVINP